MSNYGDVRQALAASELETARDLLREYLEKEPETAEVWYLAAQAAVNEKQRRYFLEKAVACDPLHAAAGNELHALLAGAGKGLPIAQTKPEPKAHFTPAPLLNRALAFIMDHVLISFIMYILLIVVSLVMNVGSNVQAASNAVLIWMMFSTVFYIGYFGYSFTQGQGQTVGKRMMGVRVIKRNGSPLRWYDAVLRCWVGYLLSFAPLGLGFLWVLVDADQRAWHDLITDTQVIKA